MSMSGLISTSLMRRTFHIRPSRSMCTPSSDVRIAVYGVQVLPERACGTPSAAGVVRHLDRPGLPLYEVVMPDVGTDILTEGDYDVVPSLAVLPLVAEVHPRVAELEGQRDPVVHSPET